MCKFTDMKMTTDKQENIRSLATKILLEMQDSFLNYVTTKTGPYLSMQYL